MGQDCDPKCLGDIFKLVSESEKELVAIQVSLRVQNVSVVSMKAKQEGSTIVKGGKCVPPFGGRSMARRVLNHTKCLKNNHC